MVNTSDAALPVPSGPIRSDTALSDAAPAGTVLSGAEVEAAVAAVVAEAWAGGRTVSDPRLSPDGTRVAFVAGYPHGSELVLVPSAGGAEQWLPCVPAVTTGGSHGWLPDGRSIVYAGVDGRVHRLDLATAQCRPLTPSGHEASTVAVSPDGALVAFVAGTQHVLVVSTQPGGWPRCLSAGADYALDPAWSPDGAWLAWHEWDQPNMPWYGSRIMIRRVDGSGQPQLVDGGHGVAVAQPRFSPDGLRLGYLCDRDGWLNVWTAKLGADGASPRPLVAEPAEHGVPAWGAGHRTYAWGPGAGQLAYWRNDEGWGRLDLLDTDGTQLQLSADGLTGLHASAGLLVGVAAGPALAECIQVLRPGNRPVTIAFGAVAGVQRAGVEPERVSWTSGDGTTVPGRLYHTPVPGDGPPPLLVWLHEGPSGQSLVTLQARFGYFLQRGWSVLVPDYRGSTGWGRRHLDALTGRWGEADLADVAAGIRAAATHGWGDPALVVPYGGSAGGFLTLRLLVTHPELCAAGVALYPVADLLDFRTPPWRYQARYLETLLGPLPGSYPAFAERSPLARAADLTVPLLVLHGELDPIVPAAHCTALVHAARRAGATVEHHTYPGQAHGWVRGPAVADELHRVESFLRRHVLHQRTLH